MKYWKYVLEEDDGEIGYLVISEAEILKQFFSEWKQQMEEMGREDEINEQNCIEEWVIYYSAWQ
jgi:hypothetical protein